MNKFKIGDRVVWCPHDKADKSKPIKTIITTTAWSPTQMHTAISSPSISIKAVSTTSSQIPTITWSSTPMSTAVSSFYPKLPRGIEGEVINITSERITIQLQGNSIRDIYSPFIEIRPASTCETCRYRMYKVIGSECPGDPDLV